MEKQLNYNRLLSLKEIAFRRTAIALCTKPGILKLITEFQFSYEKFWREDRFHYVSQIFSTRILPESLQEQLTPIVKSVGDEILRWKLYHKEYLNGDICMRVLKKLRWTTAGTVNYRETAEELVRCDVLDAEKRFLLASFYCLEDYIPALWRELSDEDKKIFYKGNIARMKKPRLQLFLPNILERAESMLSRYDSSDYFNGGPLNNSFERAAVLGNKTLAEYCWGKLKKAEREASLVRAARCVIRYRKYLDCKMNAIPFIGGRLLSEVSRYLLSLMTSEQQNGILRELPCEVLRFCLDWPYQDLFLDVADVVWTFLPESKYAGLLGTAIHTFLNPGYYFPAFFQKFFLRSPVNFRKCFADHNLSFFSKFICAKDTETIRVFLRNLEAADRARLVFTEESLRLFYSSTWSYEWPVLEVFLREATLTRVQKRRLKVAFKKYARKYDGMALVEWGKHRRFFEFCG